MNCMMTLLSVTVFALAGCVYESPLAVEHNISVDPVVLGLWEALPDAGEEQEQNERMVILKYSDTEYLIHYPPGGNDEAYYRGYPIKIGGVSCVQLQIVGTDHGPIDADERGLFHVVSYQLTNDRLMIKVLNTDMVDDDLETMDELRQEFLKHLDNKDLFKDPGVFRRVERES